MRRPTARCSWRPPPLPSLACCRRDDADALRRATPTAAGAGAPRAATPRSTSPARRLRPARAGPDAEQRRDLRGRQQLLQRQLGHRPGLHRGPRRPRPAVQRPVVLVVPLPGRAGQPPADADDPERGLLLRLSVARRRRAARPRPRLRRPAPGPRHPRRAGRGHDRDHHDRAARHVRRRHPVHARRPDLRDRSTPHGEPVDRRDDLAPGRAGRLRGRPARGRARRGHLAAPTPTTTTATASRGAPTSSPTPRPAASRARPLRLEGGRAERRAADRRRLRGDIGITSSLRPDSPAPACRPSASPRPTGGDPELDDRKLDQVTFYTRTLAVPARRDVGDADTARAGALRRPRLRVAATSPSCAPARPTSTALDRPGDPPVHRPAAPRHGRRPRRRPRPTAMADRHASGARRRCGASAWSRPSTATPASCTTAGRATSRRRSSGTAARPRPRATRFRALDAKGGRAPRFLESL